jgi:hypothetical protein
MLRTLLVTMMAPAYISARTAGLEKAEAASRAHAHAHYVSLCDSYDSLLDGLTAVMEHEVLPLRADAEELAAALPTLALLRKSVALQAGAAGNVAAQKAELARCVDASAAQAKVGAAELARHRSDLLQEEDALFALRREAAGSGAMLVQARAAAAQGAEEVEALMEELTGLRARVAQLRGAGR